MKKTLLLTAIAVYSVAFAQCKIVGNSQAKTTQPETYTIENDNAQCTDCHLWSVIGSNAAIDGEFRKNSVKIVPNSGGRIILSLTTLTSQGVSQCSKNIDIADNSVAATPSPEQNVNCDVEIKNFKEVKFAEGIVSFFPIEQNPKDFKFTWTVSYANGDKKESTEKVPQFPYSEANPINDVKVKIFSGTCLKSFTKNYEANYWKIFK